MAKLVVKIADAPAEFGAYGRIRLLHQSKKGFVPAVDGAFELELDHKEDRSGVLQWSGDAVHYHGDKRRFIYFAWVSEFGQSFRRIKLYLDQVPELEYGDAEVTIAGRMPKDGSPACSTAKRI